MWTVTTPWFLPFLMLSLRDDAFTRARDHFNTEITTELSVPVQSVRGVGGETWDSEEIRTDYSIGTVAPPVVVDEYAVEKKANDSCQGVDQHRECLAIAVKVMASSMEREVEGLQRIVETVGISDLGGNNISTRANRTSTCLYPLQVLDFLHDWSDPNLLEASWPCETRAYWSKQLLPLVSLVRFLFTYVAPLMVVLGLVMNSLSFVVLNTPPLNTTNLSVYLRALALTDNSTLLVNVAMSLARAHIPAVSRLYTNNQWMCATNKVFMGTLYHYSTWLVVALTWARLFTIKYPLSLGWCSDRVAIYVVTALGVAFITLSGMRVRYPGFEQDSVFEYEPCQINVSVSRGTNMNSAVFVYLTLSLWLPLTLILMGNLCLLTVVRRSVKTRSTLTAIRKKSLPPLDTFKLTRMLSLVSSAYLILLLPLGVAATLEIYWDVVIKKSPALEGPARLIYLNWLKRKLLFKWIRGLCYFVYLFHFCINFFLYCISGQKFRRVVILHIRGALPLGMSRFFCREDARTSGSTPFTLTKKGDRRPSPTNSGPSSQTVAHPASSSHPSKCGYVNEAFTLKECVSPL